MLPTHTKGRNGGPPTAVKLQSAFDKGMNMAGLKSTKGGAGEKERAYIIRQNWVLKTLLLLVVVFSVGTTVLFSTVLQVSVTRREAMRAEKVHHQLEHKAQVRLMNAHLELQKALEGEIHETARLEEFRSLTDRALGDEQAGVAKILKDAGVDAAVVAAVDTESNKCRTVVSDGFSRFLVHFQGVSEKARTSMKRVAHAIVSDVELEQKEEDRFRSKMAHNFGVDVDAIDAEQAIKEAHDYDHYGVLDQQDLDDQEEDDDEEIAEELENFFAKLNKHDFPLMSQEVLDSWEVDMRGITDTLEDAEKEVDLEQIVKRVNANIAMHAPGVAAYDPDKHSSIVDYFEMRIEEAKLAFHKQSLLDLYAGWKDDGKISTYTVLAGLEQIAETNDMYLLYEWLDGNEADEDDEDDEA